MYDSEKIVLSADDFEGVDIEVDETTEKMLNANMDSSSDYIAEA